MSRTVASLPGRGDISRARAWLERFDAQTLRWQRAIAAIPAPTGDERRRGEEVARRLAELGLDRVRRDAAGNVLATYGGGEEPGVVIAAHLDTVFPAGTDLTVKEQGARIVAPGISDNARGLAGLLALAGACRHAGLGPGAPFTFVATTGEEGAGDLAGAKHLFTDRGFAPVAFIALDGAGTERVVHRALGSRRLRAAYRGPGGHSWAAFGVANPAYAVGVAAAAIGEMPLPAQPRSTASVVRIGGGSGLNTIPQEAWLELDLRSESEAALDLLYDGTSQALARALDVANRRRTPGSPPLTLQLVPLGQRPCGVTDSRHGLVQAAVAATESVGREAELAAASTDANVAISRGIPGIALGAGGRGGDAHLATEWYENVDAPSGVYRALLVACTMAGLRES